MQIDFTTEFLARFWAKVDKTPGQGPKGDCWCWTGDTNWDNYGQLKVQGKTYRAHRLSYQIEKGDTTGWNVRHTCDHPPCVRPDHLVLGTQADNIKDMVERGRLGRRKKGHATRYAAQIAARDARLIRRAQINWPSVNAARFWSKVEKTDHCWLWRGHLAATSKWGLQYGLFTVSAPARKLMGAHQAAYLLTRGPIPKGIVVCHECDNPICVRPSHLFLGTHVDNAQDSLAKGRRPLGARHWTHQQPERAKRIWAENVRKVDKFGEKNPSAKLTEDQAYHIYKVRFYKIASVKDVCARFGVCKSSVLNLMSGRTYPALRLRIEREIDWQQVVETFNHIGEQNER